MSISLTPNTGSAPEEKLLNNNISTNYTTIKRRLTSDVHSDPKNDHPDCLLLLLSLDPRGGHVLPQTVDWLAAPAASQHYLVTLGFRKREDSLLLKMIYSIKWPSPPGLSTVYVCIESYLTHAVNAPIQQVKQSTHSSDLMVSTVTK